MRCFLWAWGIKSIMQTSSHTARGLIVIDSWGVSTLLAQDSLGCFTCMSSFNCHDILLCRYTLGLLLWPLILHLQKHRKGKHLPPMQFANERSSLGVPHLSDPASCQRRGGREGLFPLEKEWKSQWSKPVTDEWVWSLLTLDRQLPLCEAVYLIWLFTTSWASVIFLHPSIAREGTGVCSVRGTCPWPHSWEECEPW